MKQKGDSRILKCGTEEVDKHLCGCRINISWAFDLSLEPDTKICLIKFVLEGYDRVTNHLLLLTKYLNFSLSLIG